TQPNNQTAFVGENVSMSVAVTGSRPLVCQWKMNGTNLLDGGNISGSTTLTLLINGLTTNNAGTYSVVVSNAFGWAQSADATLSVTSSAPIIVVQPYNFTVSPGASVTLNVSAIGNSPLAYQWRTNGFNVANGGNVSGSTSGALTIRGAT